MGLTVSHVDEGKYVEGNKKVRIVSVTFDNSYADNGESLTASDVGLSKIVHVAGEVAKKSDHANAVGVVYDYANSKLLAYIGDNDAGADGAFVEAGAIDLSGYTVRLKITGR